MGLPILATAGGTKMHALYNIWRSSAASTHLLGRTAPRLLFFSSSQGPTAGTSGARFSSAAQQHQDPQNPYTMLLQQSPQQQEMLLNRFGCFIYRWLDITGFLTRWHSRKAWVLDLDPYSRMAAPLITEYERKMVMFVGLHAYFFFFVAMYLTAKGHAHAAVKPPVPRGTDFPGVDGRKKDFTWHGRLFFIEPRERCKECRWLDLECKKNCFEQLKARGHKLILNNSSPLSVPRDHLKAAHTH